MVGVPFSVEIGIRNATIGILVSMGFTFVSDPLCLVGYARK